MTTTEKIKLLAEQTQLSQNIVKTVLDANDNLMREELIMGNDVALPFGRLSVGTLKERRNYNMITKEFYTAPESKTVKFSVFKTFKDVLNK